MMRKEKKITAQFWVRINGEYVLLESLPEEKRKQILVELNDRAMRAIGYVPVEKEKETTA